MRAGKLNRQITIENYTTATNTYGEEVENWVTFATVRAEVIPMGGREAFNSGQVQNFATLKIRIRRLSGLDTAMRVVYDGAVFNIMAINEIGLNVGHELMVEREAANES